MQSLPAVPAFESVPVPPRPPFAAFPPPSQKWRRHSFVPCALRVPLQTSVYSGSVAGPHPETIDQSRDRRGRIGDGVAEPGLLKVFAAGAAAFEPIPLVESRLLIGRGEECHLRLDDARASRAHAEINHTGGRFTVRDLGSPNATFLHPERIH